jgi:hypothetical protein
MKKCVLPLLAITLLLSGRTMYGQMIPNNSFESWTSFGSYENPVSWDTPNEELSTNPFYGPVVTKSTDHEDGTYSAKLETRHFALPPLDVPGFMTLGTLTVDILAGTYTLTGGIPITDMPTHLKGYYKYSPLGGDSCVIGIGMTRWNNATGIRDSISWGYFSTHTAATDWTAFSVWINYDTIIQPDTMNIIAMSTAQEVMTSGTTLWVDNIFLDYTLGYDERNPRAGIDIYQDRETKRLLVFYDLPKEQYATLSLYNMTGQRVRTADPVMVRSGRQVLSYNDVPPGVYILEVLHDNKICTRKYFLNH